MAEAWACKFGLEAAVCQGISNIVLEMDSAILKGALTSDDRDLAPEGAFIGACGSLFLIILPLCRLVMFPDHVTLWRML